MMIMTSERTNLRVKGIENNNIILVTVPSEERIIHIERDIKRLRERVACLEERRRQEIAGQERIFKLKIVALGFVLPVLSSIVTCLLSRLGIVP